MIRFSKFIAEGADATLADKAKKSGFSLGILKQVYKRGMAAWKVGHKPGTTPQQWGMARVNSFITGGRTRVKGDPDLWAKQKGKIKKPKKEDVNENESVNEISQNMQTRYYRKAVATNRHGNTQMKALGARHFGKPEDAEKAQKRADSVRSKMATARPTGEDSDAVKAFLAKGGKIKKLPPGKAQGYHGKDDPGKDMHGMMNKPDTKGFKKNKFVGSMK